MTDRELMQQALEAAPLSEYSKADNDFHKWWYSHMQNDLMQPPLNEVGYRVARYIWDAALRERLAQPEHKPMHPTLQKMWEGYFDKCYKREPEQEPVAWIYRDSWGTMKLSQVTPPPVGAFPVYTAPTQRKPLTDEEISDLWCKVSNTDFVTADTHVFARAIEAAHGIKGGA